MLKQILGGVLIAAFVLSGSSAFAKKTSFSDKATAKITSAQTELADIQTKAVEYGITIDQSIIDQFNTLLGQAETAFAAGDYKAAMSSAGAAKDLLEPVESQIETAEALAEATQEIAELQADEQEIISEAAAAGITLPADVIAQFDTLISEAQAAITAGDPASLVTLLDQAKTLLESLKALI